MLINYHFQVAPVSLLVSGTKLNEPFGLKNHVNPPSNKHYTIAAHVLEQLLERGYKVVTTVRSEDKAQKIRDAHKDLGKDDLDIVIVPDIAQPDAFDEVVKIPGIEYVLHTASPFHFNFCEFFSTSPLTKFGDTSGLFILHFCPEADQTSPVLPIFS
jgi:hypothetical protein